MMKLPAIIIILYHPAPDFFEHNLQLDDYTYILVDNSPQPQREFIAKVIAKSNAIYLPLNENHGIAKALNIGIQHAQQLGYQNVITMDQDSYITQDIIEKLCEYYQNKQDSTIAIVSPLHIMQDGHVSKRHTQLESNSIFTMTSGNLLNIEIWQTLGGFNEDLFIDMVDLDYNARAILAGFKVLTIKSIPMQHTMGDVRNIKILNKVIPVMHHNYLRKYYQVRNALWFYKKHHKELPQVRRTLLLMVFVNLFGVLFFEKDKWRKLKFMFYGVKDFIFKRYGKCAYA